MNLAEMSGKDITFARQDPALSLVELFNPVPKDGERAGGLSYWIRHSDYDIQFAVWQQLDGLDQSVLLAASAMAHIEHEELRANDGGELWDKLEPLEEAQKDKAVVIETTRYKLMQAAGLVNEGRAYERLKNSLFRLSNVTCRVFRGRGEWSMRFLSYGATKEGTIRIALNGRFAKALNHQYDRIDLQERRALNSEPAKIAHAWLSAWMRPGEEREIGIDKLTTKVWGETSDNPNTQSSRRTRLMKAIDKINALDTWRIDVTGRGRRAKATVRQAKVIEQGEA